MDKIVEKSLRVMREKFRTMATSCIHGEDTLVINEAIDIKKDLEVFVKYMANKVKKEKLLTRVIRGTSEEMTIPFV